MKDGLRSHIKKLILSLLVVSGFLVSSFSQTKINGTINLYGHVTGIGADYVNVDDLTQFNQFAIGDTILLIQMKGAKIYATESSAFGTLENLSGKPGKHEFLLISGIDGGAKKITFKNAIKNNFDVEGLVQIIKVPSYKNSAVVDNSDLICSPWDSISKTGGVLTLIVGKTLILNKNIDVSGKGFLGGAISEGSGLCIGTDPSNLDKYIYNSFSTYSGFKGESPASKGTLLSGPPYFPLYPDYAKGKGPLFTGGGGGNGRFSGGGGGANYGSGGKGDIETCGYPPGANGGFKIKLSALDGGIFMGGGGGSSTYLNDGSTPSPGGKGGGIVIIVCGEIDGNGKSILANGATAVKALSNSGSGGGGGGGSVALYLENFASSSLTISANGGNGGDNAGIFGTGGGGGGGLIKISNITVPGNVTRTVSKGLKGLRSSGISSSTDGAVGENITDFVAVLNGFLFNIIRSSVTGNQADSVCSDMPLPIIAGTKPVGGTRPYTYLWEKSYERTFASPITLTLVGSDSVNYTPKPADVITPTDTVFFRRSIIDSSTPSALTDVSKFVKFTVHPKIQNNNIIVDPDTICYNGDPQLLKQKLPDLIIPTTSYLKYSWQDSIVGGTWSAERATTKEYDPNSLLTVDTWYRRTVKSGSCIDRTAIAKIKVLPKIADNSIINLADTICFGGNTGLATIPGPTGGLPTDYRYKWEYSTTGSSGTWGAVTGGTNVSYDPDVSVSLPVGNHYYRRIIYSGEQDVCKDTSTSALRKVWPVIVNNLIKADQTIGYDSIPTTLVQNTGFVTGGSGAYTYSWVKDTLNYPVAPGPNAVNQTSYLPPILKWTVAFKRTVKSSVCRDTSNSVKIIVDSPITNTISLATIALDTIYSGQDPGQINGSVPTGGSGIAGDYSYKWYKSLTGGPLKSEWTEITGNILINMLPGNLTQTTWFRRNVSSPSVLIRSTYESNKVMVTVLPKILNFDLSANQAICFGKRPLQITGSALSGGDGKYRFTWQDSTSLHSWQDIPGFVKCDSANYKPPVLTSDTKYKRIVYSGKNNCGSETSKVVIIKVNPLPAAVITNTADTTICAGSQVELKIRLTGPVSDWKVTYQENLVAGSVNTSTTTNKTLLASPGSTTASTIYNYSLFKVEDANGCIATSLTGTKKAVVYKIPIANAGPQVDTVCGPTVTLTAIPSVGTGTWLYPSAVVASTPNNTAVTVSVDSTFTGKSITHKFIWKEINWQCAGKDSINVTFFKRAGPVNAGNDTTLYSFDNIFHTVATAVLVGTGQWSVVEGSGDFNDYSANTTIVSNLTKGMNKFRWKVTNGKCVSEDIVAINIYDIFIPEGFSPNSDGINDKFFVTGLDLPNQIAELKIVNSAGVEVFSTSNSNGQEWTDWDGKNINGAGMPEGTYYYLLKMTSAGSSGNGQVFKKSGFIILKRY
jgi:gliding motility-associated-like protein